MGPAGRRASPDRAGAGGRGDIGVVRPDDLRWTGKLPEDCRQDADEILVLAAKSGADLRDLAGLVGEIYARSLPGDPDKDEDQAFEDRSVRLETTFDGAGVLNGDLTPECAAVVGTVLDALSAPAGAEDTRSQAQRCHDALQEAHARLVDRRAAAGAGRAAGESLGAHLAGRPDGAGRQLRRCWRSGPAGSAPPGPAHRAEASAGGGDGGAWLDGDAAGGRGLRRGDGPVRDRRGQPGRPGGPGPAVRGAGPAPPPPPDRQSTDDASGGGTGTGASGQAAPAPDTTRAWEALEQAIIGKAVDLLSGPGGLACFLRRRQLGARLGGPSLPLDIGYCETIPAGIRNAVILRDQHCQWARRVQPARRGVRGPPCQAQGERRQDQRPRLCCCFASSITRS